ncbi:MAG: ROK family protein [Reichenbachiella sp.]
MKDSPLILTLDAGGTNFVFSAMKDREIVTNPINKKAYADNLNHCLESLFNGFKETITKLKSPPDAISFAFPGPANYHMGIIGNLPNFNAFNGDTPLGPILENEFGIPVYINNDGNLFAYGEATSGQLPVINEKLKKAGSLKKFNNLIGITLGTGIGSGIVIDGHLLLGDNACGAEIHNTLNRDNSNWNCEESISTRAIQRVYAEESDIAFDSKIFPGDIYNIAKGKDKGNKEAALSAFKQFGTSLGSTICNIVSIIDGLVVIGGGITKGWDLFGSHTLREINKSYRDHTGKMHDRLSYRFFDLTREEYLLEFTKGSEKKMAIPGSGKELVYDTMPRTGITLSQIGASQSIMLGAYDFAVSKLQNK